MIKITFKSLNSSTIQHVKRFAFTLAETLIVIGIIGVVAALTLPNLNHATGDKEKVTKVKKIYSALTDAVDRAQVIYGDMDTWVTTVLSTDEVNARFARRVTEFMKVSKDCGFDSGCFSKEPLLYSDGGSVANQNYLDSLQNEKRYMVTLSDGISLSFYYEVDGYARIKIDIDGPSKGKNQEGYDIFDFMICLTQSENYNTDYCGKNAPINQLTPDARPDRWTGNLLEGDYINYTTAWVIENGNLDYLKCPDELNWETQTSCK